MYNTYQHQDHQRFIIYSTRLPTYWVIKKCTLTLDVILPEPETEVSQKTRISIEMCYKHLAIGASYRYDTNIYFESNIYFEFDR